MNMSRRVVLIAGVGAYFAITSGAASVWATTVTVNAAIDTAAENQGIFDNNADGGGLDGLGDAYSYTGFAPPIGHRDDGSADTQANYVAVHEFQLPAEATIDVGNPVTLIGATLKSFLNANTAVAADVGNLNLVGLGIASAQSIVVSDFETTIAARDAGGVGLVYDDIATPTTAAGNGALPDADVLAYINSVGYLDDGWIKLAFVREQPCLQTTAMNGFSLPWSPVVLRQTSRRPNWC